VNLKVKENNDKHVQNSLEVWA